MLLKWLTTLKTLVVKTNNMSSKFSSSFLSKSPLLAGEYGSGVDGMRYFSPKQPASKNPAKPTVPKKQDKTVKDITGDVPVEEIITTEDKTILPSEKNIDENRTNIRKVPGKEVERIETDQKLYIDGFKPEYERLAAEGKFEGTIEQFIDFKNEKYKDRTFGQNQTRNITTNTDVDGVETVTTGDWGNDGDEYEITEEN